MRQESSIRIFAESSNNEDGLNIYLSFAGQTDYLMHYRDNIYLYKLLKDGLTLDEFERRSHRTALDVGSMYDSGPKRRRNQSYSRKLEDRFKQVITAANEYVLYKLEAA